MPNIRHLTVDDLRSYLSSGAPAAIRLDGSPAGFLIIDPAHARIGVQLPAVGKLPNCVRYANIHVARVRQRGSDWNQLGIEGASRLEDLYPLLCQVLDRVQLEGQAFSDAVEDVLAVYDAVLARRAAMAEETQVGLFGELLVLLHLFETDPSRALESWLGPAREEHDFGFENFAVEVKATTSEARRHWISSADQLTPTAGKKLYLMSIQLTAGGLGGRTLPDLVSEVLTISAALRSRAIERLTAAGYDERDRDLYPKRWELRTAARAYHIDDSFPVISSEVLLHLVPQSERVVDLRYQLDLTSMQSCIIPALEAFTEGPASSQ